MLHSTPLSYTPDPARGGTAPGAHSSAAPADRFERETIEIVKRLSRGSVEISTRIELMADLGFDSLQVLELVGELEDHFNIAVPLNTLTHIRTVGEIAAEVRRIVTEVRPAQP